MNCYRCFPHLPTQQLPPPPFPSVITIYRCCQQLLQAPITSFNDTIVCNTYFTPSHNTYSGQVIPGQLRPAAFQPSMSSPIQAPRSVSQNLLSSHPDNQARQPKPEQFVLKLYRTSSQHHGLPNLLLIICCFPLICNDSPMHCYIYECCTSSSLLHIKVRILNQRKYICVISAAYSPSLRVQVQDTRTKIKQMPFTGNKENPEQPQS